MPPRKDTSNDDQPTSFQDQLSALNTKVDALVNIMTKLLQASPPPPPPTPPPNHIENVTAQNTTPVNVTTTIATPQTSTQQITTPQPNTPKLTMFFEGPNPLIEDKVISEPTSQSFPLLPVSTTTTVLTITSEPLLQTPLRLPQTLPFKCLNVTKMQADMFQGFCFKFTDKYHLIHQCNASTFHDFQLQHGPGPAKKDPPWGIFIVDHGNLGLEDKAVFKDGSIDTCMTRLVFEARCIDTG
ncbi:hypothetical protein Tco_1557527 [Tanacetum coccineum]